MNKNDEMQAKLVNFLRNWAIPGAVALAGAAGYVARIADDVAWCKIEIRKVRHDLERTHIVGPDGLLDPASHSRLDRHIEHYLEQKLGSLGFRKFLGDYSSVGNGRDWKP